MRCILMEACAVRLRSEPAGGFGAVRVWTCHGRMVPDGLNYASPQASSAHMLRYPTRKNGFRSVSGIPLRIYGGMRLLHLCGHGRAWHVNSTGKDFSHCHYIPASRNNTPCRQG